MNEWLHQLRSEPGPVLVALLGLSLPISTALTNILAALVPIVVLHPRYLPRLLHALKSAVVWLALALLLALAIGVSYSNAPLKEALDALNSYRKLLLLVLLVPLFYDAHARRAGLLGLQIGLGLTLLASYLELLTGWTLPGSTSLPGVVFKNPVTQGLLLALAAYLWGLQAATRTSLWRWPLALAALLAVCNVVFVTLGASAYLVLAVLILLLAGQLGQHRGLVLGTLLVIVLGGLVYSQSTSVQSRVEDFHRELVRQSPGRTATPELRWDYYRHTPKLLLEHPLTGTGTGSFPYEFERLANAYGLPTRGNPHNEYLMLGVQLGIPGILLFVGLLAALWRHSAGLMVPERWQGQALVAFMAIGCLVNSLLLYITEGHLFAFLAGLLIAIPSQNRR